MTNDLKPPFTIKQLETVVKSKFENHSADDLFFSVYTHRNKKIAVFGITYLIDKNKLERALLAPLLNYKRVWKSSHILDELPLDSGSTCDCMENVFEQLIKGYAFIYIEHEDTFIQYPLQLVEERSLDKSETESVIIGPQIAFSESLNTNLNMVRQFLPTTDLVIEKFTVGKIIPSEVRMIYMKSVANEDDVNTMRQRIQDVDVDEIDNSTTLKQYIEDSTLSLFPQFFLTELPTHLSYTIKAGKIGVLVENSPDAFIAPASFFSFFETVEDNYLRWIQASTLRLLRIISIPITLLLTPLYIAIVTFRYELVPTSLIMTIGQSRAGVPFPPLIEALLIEVMIELLREAGVRLPTKIGQTMGIVGGLVIGQAAVEAGLTSNVLIIVVAASALASFTTPSYLIGTSFRVLRFLMIILAGMYGLLGVMFGICFILIHLIRTTSLGRPYLSPLYPLRLRDFNRVFVKTPPSENGNRATMYRPKDQRIFSKKDAKQINDYEKQVKK